MPLNVSETVPRLKAFSPGLTTWKLTMADWPALMVAGASSGKTTTPAGKGTLTEPPATAVLLVSSFSVTWPLMSAMQPTK
ncbi:MAG: hypothetical protein HY303_20005 [Candidatus Wallbacteria bacterium]|nr:hypothetical protein [Candidatus Wallbacteria bacterium]